MMAYGENTSLAERKKRAAQRMILGFEGLDISPEIKRFAKRNAPAGYILFRRNVEEPAQVLEMNRALQDLNGKENPPLLSVDQEGGRVPAVQVVDHCKGEAPLFREEPLEKDCNGLGSVIYNGWRRSAQDALPLT